MSKPLVSIPFPHGVNNRDLLLAIAHWPEKNRVGQPNMVWTEDDKKTLKKVNAVCFNQDERFYPDGLTVAELKYILSRATPGMAMEISANEEFGEYVHIAEVRPLNLCTLNDGSQTADMVLTPEELID